MKTLILWVLLFLPACNSNAQNVNIPDPAFLSALIDLGVDTNGDSLISYAESEAIASLCVSERRISNMAGISGGSVSDKSKTGWFSACRKGDCEVDKILFCIL